MMRIYWQMVPFLSLPHLVTEVSIFFNPNVIRYTLHFTISSNIRFWVQQFWKKNSYSWSDFFKMAKNLHRLNTQKFNWSVRHPLNMHHKRIKFRWYFPIFLCSHNFLYHDCSDLSHVLVFTITWQKRNQVISWYKTNIDCSIFGGWLNLLPLGALETATIFPWAFGPRENSSGLQSTSGKYHLPHEQSIFV